MTHETQRYKRESVRDDKTGGVRTNSDGRRVSGLALLGLLLLWEEFTLREGELWILSGDEDRDSATAAPPATCLLNLTKMSNSGEGVAAK